MKTKVLLSFLTALTMMLAGCSDDDNNLPVTVSGITLNLDELELIIDETGQLESIVVPDDAEDKFVTWTVDNPAVAKVDDNGLVTAVAYGEATIQPQPAKSRPVAW